MDVGEAMAQTMVELLRNKKREDETMLGSSDWKPPKTVAFATLLCLLMLGGELVSGSKNPMSLVFYCFLPAVIWMIANGQNRNAEVIAELKTQVDRLEESPRLSSVAK